MPSAGNVVGKTVVGGAVGARAGGLVGAGWGALSGFATAFAEPLGDTMIGDFLYVGTLSQCGGQGAWGTPGLVVP